MKGLIMGLALFAAMAGNAVAQDLTAVASKDAGAIMVDDWDGLNGSQRAEIVKLIAEGTTPLKVAELYEKARGGQAEEVLSALTEESLFKVFEALNDANKGSGEKLVQALPSSRIEKYLTFSAKFHLVVPKVTVLNIATEGQLKTLIPKADAGLLAELLSNNDDREVIKVVLELMQGKCGASTARARKSSSSKPKPKPKPKPEPEKQEVDGACKDTTKTTCQTPIVPRPTRVEIR